MDWTAIQRQLYYFFRFFVPYMADYVHKSIRRKHFRDISEQMYSTFDQSFWEDQTGRTVRISCDETDCQLAYVDFLDYR